MTKLSACDDDPMVRGARDFFLAVAADQACGDWPAAAAHFAPHARVRWIISSAEEHEGDVADFIAIARLCDAAAPPPSVAPAMLSLHVEDAARPRARACLDVTGHDGRAVRLSYEARCEDDGTWVAHRLHGGYLTDFEGRGSRDCDWHRPPADLCAACVIAGAGDGGCPASSSWRTVAR